MTPSPYAYHSRPDGRGFHEKAGLCQEVFHPAPSGIFSGPTNGRRDEAPAFKVSLSLISGESSERRELVKGARFLRGLRTLDKFPPFRKMDSEGKGTGGLRGLAPWRSLRQRLMRAPRALLPTPMPYSVPTTVSLSSDCILLVVFRAIVAMLPSAL